MGQSARPRSVEPDLRYRRSAGRRRTRRRTRGMRGRARWPGVVDVAHGAGLGDVGNVHDREAAHPEGNIEPVPHPVGMMGPIPAPRHRLLPACAPRRALCEWVPGFTGIRASTRGRAGSDTSKMLVACGGSMWPMAARSPRTSIIPPPSISRRPIEVTGRVRTVSAEGVDAINSIRPRTVSRQRTPDGHRMGRPPRVVRVRTLPQFILSRPASQTGSFAPVDADEPYALLS
jgi:hypothetical protein